MTAAASLDAAFAALADPTRRAIVARLAQGEATVLERAELISRGRDAQRRPCRLRTEALREVAQWAEHTRQTWEERFDRLDQYLRQAQAAQGTSSHQENRRGRSRS